MFKMFGCGSTFFPARMFLNKALTVVGAMLAVLIAAGCMFTTGQLEAAQCSNGVAVAEPLENSGLVADCAILLDIRDKLTGDATLNWSAQLPLDEWDGVSVDSGTTPLRVTEVRLDGRGLTG